MNDEARAQLLKIRLLGGSEADRLNWLVWYWSEPHASEPEIGELINPDAFVAAIHSAATRAGGPHPFEKALAAFHQASQPEVP